MKNRFLVLLCVAISFCSLTGAWADASSESPVGQWMTIDDRTDNVSGRVRLYEENGKLYGKVLWIAPGYRKTCEKCVGDLKGQPVKGLRFLWDFIPKGNGLWADGQLLDPETGDIYHGTINLVDHGNRLLLRGYWLIFWRTQTWVRDDGYPPDQGSESRRD
jgi:uncharacterized protein (DUF2147 family)